MHQLNGTNGHATKSLPSREHRLPPQNIEAETGVLGSVLLDNAMLDEVIPRLKAEDFYRDSHQIIYQAIQDLYSQGGAADIVTLADELARREQFHRIGGDSALLNLVESVPHAANAKYYADIVRQKSQARALVTAATEVLEEVYKNNKTAPELLNFAQSKVMAITEDNPDRRIATLHDSIDEVIGLIDLRQDPNAITGLPSGFYDLDDRTCGFQPGSFNILAARPSMGKTAIGANIAEHVAITLDPPRPVLFVSLEMTKNQLIERMVCGRSGIDGHKIATGVPRLSNADWEKIRKARSELDTSLLTIDETPSQDVLQIMATARGIHRRTPLGLIVVDYVQIVAAEDDSRPRQEQVAKISARLKALARETGVPVLALAQLNREVEKREDRRPRMADLKESGALEQDADTVMLLHRPEYYDPDDKPGIAELIVAKNRHGATGTAVLTFLRNIFRFESMSPREPNDPPLGAF